MDRSSIKFIYLSLSERMFTPATTQGGRESSNCCWSFVHVTVMLPGLQMQVCGCKNATLHNRQCQCDTGQVDSLGAVMIPEVIVLHPGHLPGLCSPSIQMQTGSNAAGLFIFVSLLDVINSSGLTG